NSDDPYEAYASLWGGTEEKKELTDVDDFRASPTPEDEDGMFTVGFTYTTIGDEAFVGTMLSPEFSLGKMDVGLDIPLLYGLDSRSYRTELFKDGVGPFRIIRYARYGVQKQDPIYARLGQLDGVMIGYGGLVNNYSNTTSFEKRKLGVHFDLNYSRTVGLEGMYSDFDLTSVNLLSVRPYVRPFASSSLPLMNSLELGATIVSDRDQTSFPNSDTTRTSYLFTSQGVNAFGLDIGTKVLTTPFMQVHVFANYSNLSIQNDSLQSLSGLFTGDSSTFETGSGMSFGANFRMQVIEDVFRADVRLEWLSYQDHYLPQFFDAFYEINKDNKIANLIASEAQNGIYGSLTGHILQIIKLGGSVLIPNDISQAASGVVRIHADVERLADKVSLHGSYLKGGLEKLGDAFKLDQRSLAKLRITYHLNDFLVAGVNYYHAFSQLNDGSFQMANTVMPYVGLSITP
ncbi:MAG: hypothetical protein AAF551_13460, partial [Bacteroidota bacterium]